MADGRRAYVLLSHRDPDLVERTARRIRASSPGAEILILHDDRSAPAPAAAAGVTVRTHGLRTDWGSWDIVEAMLAGLRWAHHEVAAELVLIISGQDYPTRPLRAWEDELLASGAHACLVSRPLRYQPKWGTTLGVGDDDLTRYAYRWWNLRRLASLPSGPASIRRHARRVRDGIFLRLEPVVGYREVARGRGAFLGVRRLRSPFSAARPCWKGSQWMALDSVALAEVLDLLTAHPSLTQIYRHTVIPDESLIQTVLGWSGLPVRQAEVTYADWPDPREAPRVLTLDDLPAIVEAGTPFCRKVDTRHSSELLDALDALNLGS